MNTRLLSLIVTFPFLLPQYSFSEKCTMKIVSFAPLTGPAASVGTDCINVARLALDKLPAEVKGRMSMQFEDTQMKPAVAVNAFKSQFAKSRPDALIVGFSESTNAISPLAARERLVMFGIGPSRKFLDKNLFAFRHWVDPETMSPILLKEIKRKGLKRIGVIFSEHPAQAAFAEYFVPYVKKEGLEIVAQASILPEDSELRGVVSQVLGKKPDALVYFVLPPQPSILTKAVRTVNPTIPMYAFINTESLTEILNSQGAMDGVVYASPNFSKEFITEYASKYDGDYPEGLSGSFYDVVTILGKAVEQNICSGDGLRDYINGVTRFSGIAGTYGINQGREFEIPVKLKVIKNGKIFDFDGIQE